MAQEAIKLITPVGRIVWGSVYDRETEDYDGNKYNPGEGPFNFGLAIRKDDPNVGALLTAIFNQAMAGYQNNQMIVQRIQNEWQSGFTSGLFRFKIRDGDKPNQRGVLNPNTQGHWVFAMQTTLPIKCGNTMNQEIDPKSVKTGYFVDIAMTTKVNDKVDGTAGVYLNPQVVRLVAFGDEITGGPSVEEAFAGHAAPTNLPPGASLAPKAPSSEPGQGMPGMGGPGDQGNPSGMPHQQQPGGAPGQNSNGFSTMPSHSNQMPGGMPQQQMPGGMPQQQMPQQQMPQQQMPQQQMPGGLPGMPQQQQTPINPQTGMPVQPHNQFVGGPGGGLPGMPGQR